MEELEKEVVELLAKREELLGELNGLKELNDNGEITASDYLKKYDKKSEKLKKIQDKLKKLKYRKEEFIKKAEIEEKRFKEIVQKRELFSKLIIYSKEKFITVEEFTDFIFQAFNVEIDEMSENIDSEKLALIPLNELKYAITYLEQYIEQIISEETIKERIEKLKEEEEERKRLAKEAEEEEKRKLKEEEEKQKEEEKKKKELEKKQKELEKAKEKEEKEISEPEVPKILDRKIYRKKEVLPALDTKAGFVDRWALMHAISPLTKKPYVYFTELEIIVKDHPNFIHNEFRHYLEDLGYRIENESLPLPDEIQIEDKVNKVFNFAASIKGTIEVEKDKVKGFTSIYAVEEGFCTFAYGEKKPAIFCKIKFSMAADVAENMSPEDVKGDIGIIIEKLKVFKVNNDINCI